MRCMLSKSFTFVPLSAIMSRTHVEILLTDIWISFCKTTQMFTVRLVPFLLRIDSELKRSLGYFV